MKTVSLEKLKELYEKDFLRDLAGGETAGRSWIKSVNKARRSIEAEFKKYPSLRAELPQFVETAWIDARKNLQIWLEDKDQEPEEFPIPEECPYTYEQAMNRDLKKETA